MLNITKLLTIKSLIKMPNHNRNMRLYKDFPNVFYENFVYTVNGCDVLREDTKQLLAITYYKNPNDLKAVFKIIQISIDFPMTTSLFSADEV